jgi:hypothetical protein
MKNLFLAILLVALAGCGTAAAGRPADPQLEELRAELHKRVAEDQDARKKVIDAVKAGRAQNDELNKKTAEIDAANTQWLKGVVEKHGWPGKSLVGAPGAHDAWLLVQHADRDREFQKKCLELMKPLVPKGEVAKTDFAYLTDRVLVADGKKQLYGTQFHTVNGKMEPQPIEDEAKVDERRKEMGMGTLAEYRKMIEEVYQNKK